MAKVYGLNAGSWFEDPENWYLVIFIVWVVLFGGWFIRDSSLKATCLRAGYPDTRMSWQLQGYCIKRVDQTDVVVPVEQVRP